MLGVQYRIVQNALTPANHAQDVFHDRVGSDDTGLSALAHGEMYDPLRHLLEHEVKAITYHAFKVEQTNDGWLAELIVDI